MPADARCFSYVPSDRSFLLKKHLISKASMSSKVVLRPHRQIIPLRLLPVREVPSHGVNNQEHKARKLRYRRGL